MKPKICCVITGPTLNIFLSNLNKIQEIVDMVELRIDSIKNINQKDIATIRKNAKKECIFTCHNNNAVQKLALDLDFSYIDIDLNEINTFEPKTKSKLILSFHDFKITPSLKKLESVKNNMKKFKPHIMKFATMVNSERDTHTLMKFLLAKKQNENMIVIGMGNKGQITRIISPLLGGFLTYASTEITKSAPGQIKVDTLRKIYTLIL